MMVAGQLVLLFYVLASHVLIQW